MSQPWLNLDIIYQNKKTYCLFSMGSYSYLCFGILKDKQLIRVVEEDECKSKRGVGRVRDVVSKSRGFIKQLKGENGNFDKLCIKLRTQKNKLMNLKVLF